MSQHVEIGRVPFFADGPVEVSKRVERDRGHDWPLAALFFASVIASYVTGIGAIYLALTALL